MIKNRRKDMGVGQSLFGQSLCNVFFVSLIIAVSYFDFVHSAPGCMAHSSHLKEPYDDHSYRYVACSCPCNNIWRGKCIPGRNAQTCGHRHVELPKTVVRDTGIDAKNSFNFGKHSSKNITPFWYGPEKLMQNLIESGTHANKQVGRIKLAFANNK